MKCPLCKTELVPWIRWGRDTGNLVCPRCWYKCTPQGERILAKRKVAYAESMKFIQRRRKHPSFSTRKEVKNLEMWMRGYYK